MSACGECTKSGSHATCQLYIDGPFYCVRCLWQITKDYPRKLVTAKATLNQWRTVRSGIKEARLKTVDLSFPIIVDQNGTVAKAHKTGQHVLSQQQKILSGLFINQLKKQLIAAQF